MLVSTGSATAEKAGKKKGSHTEDDEAGSIVSATTLSSVQDLGYDDASVIEDDPFEQSIDALYEKRSAEYKLRAQQRNYAKAVRFLTLSLTQSHYTRERVANIGAIVHSFLLL